jgi:acyl transferase domain-containing protein
MSGRFPGAENVEQLWKNLLDKKNSISTWSVDEIDPSVPAELRNDPDYVKARGVISDADKFDAAFFGVNPKVAALMDPQQRVFLETAWAALEDAAYDPAQFSRAHRRVCRHGQQHLLHAQRHRSSRAH